MKTLAQRLNKDVASELQKNALGKFYMDDYLSSNYYISDIPLSVASHLWFAVNKDLYVNYAKMSLWFGCHTHYEEFVEATLDYDVPALDFDHFMGTKFNKNLPLKDNVKNLEKWIESV